MPFTPAPSPHMYTYTHEPAPIPNVPHPHPDGLASSCTPDTNTWTHLPSFLLSAHLPDLHAQPLVTPCVQAHAYPAPHSATPCSQIPPYIHMGVYTSPYHPSTRPCTRIHTDEACVPDRPAHRNKHPGTPPLQGSDREPPNQGQSLKGHSRALPRTQGQQFSGARTLRREQSMEMGTTPFHSSRT